MALCAPGPGHRGRLFAGVRIRTRGLRAPSAKSEVSIMKKPPVRYAMVARFPLGERLSEWRLPSFMGNLTLPSSLNFPLRALEMSATRREVASEPGVDMNISARPRWLGSTPGSDATSLLVADISNA